MSKLSNVGFGLGLVAAVVTVGHAAHAAVTTYALPGQAGIMKGPTSDAAYWTNSYGRMLHSSGGTQNNELDFPLTAIAGATALSTTVNVDVPAPYQLIGITVTPTACAQTIALDLTGTSVMATPVVCAPSNVTGHAISVGNLVPLAQFYAFVAVWSQYKGAINSVSYAITK